MPRAGLWQFYALGCRCGKDGKGVRWLLRKKVWEDVMHAVIRTFSGSGATKLLDLLEGRKSEVEALIRPVKGFVSYSLMRTADGGVSVTVCEDKAGTEEATTSRDSG